MADRLAWLLAAQLAILAITLDALAGVPPWQWLTLAGVWVGLVIWRFA